MYVSDKENLLQADSLINHRLNPLQKYDLKLLSAHPFIVGIDEAGRGCLAGSVVAGACVLHRKLFESSDALEQSARINDSKQLSAETRDAQYAVLMDLQAEGLIDFAVASGSVEEIAEFNILGATRLAMRRAVEALAVRADGWTLPTIQATDTLFAYSADDTLSSHSGQCASRPPEERVRILVDGRPLKPFPYAHEGVVKGDAKSLAIAMASIAAKVSRDREMKQVAATYPEYGFEQHKGYGTALHRAVLKAHGATPIHRALFLRKVL